MGEVTKFQIYPRKIDCNCGHASKQKELVEKDDGEIIKHEVLVCAVTHAIIANPKYLRNA